MTTQYGTINSFYTYLDLVKKEPETKSGFDLQTIEQPSSASGGVTLTVGMIVSYDSANNKYTQSVLSDIAAGTVFGVVTDLLTVHPTETKTTRVISGGRAILDYDVVLSAFQAGLSVSDRNALIAHLETKRIRIQRG